MFEAGDRVRCAAEGWRILGFGLTAGPRFNQICSVRAVMEFRNPETGEREPFLEIDGFPPLPLFRAGAFRSIGDAQIANWAALIARPPIRARELAGLIP